jgi:hypothetical protein
MPLNVFKDEQKKYDATMKAVGQATVERMKATAVAAEELAKSPRSRARGNSKASKPDWIVATGSPRSPKSPSKSTKHQVNPFANSVAHSMYGFPGWGYPGFGTAAQLAAADTNNDGVVDSAEMVDAVAKGKMGAPLSAPWAHPWGAYGYGGYGYPGYYGGWGGASAAQYAAADTNNDGVVDAKEMGTAIAKGQMGLPYGAWGPYGALYGGFNPMQAAAMAANLGAADKNKDGVIDKEEFDAACAAGVAPTLSASHHRYLMSEAVRDTVKARRKADKALSAADYDAAEAQFRNRFAKSNPVRYAVPAPPDRVAQAYKIAGKQAPETTDISGEGWLGANRSSLGGYSMKSSKA